MPRFIYLLTLWDGVHLEEEESVILDIRVALEVKTGIRKKGINSMEWID